MTRCKASGLCCLFLLHAVYPAAAAPPDPLQQISRSYPFTVPNAFIAGAGRVAIELFDPEKGDLREAVTEIEGNLVIGANTTPSTVEGVPVPYPIGFTLKQIFEGPFTVGRGDWTNLEGKFFYSGTAPGTGGYVGFNDRAFSYRIVISESTDTAGMAVPEARGPDVAPGPVGGILFSFVSSPETEGYVSWVAALLGGEDLDMAAGRIYFPVVEATGKLTITYRYRARTGGATPPSPGFPDVNTPPTAPAEPVPVPFPHIRRE